MILPEGRDWLADGRKPFRAALWKMTRPLSDR
jgi:hypothetical protein